MALLFVCVLNKIKRDVLSSVLALCGYHEGFS